MKTKNQILTTIFTVMLVSQVFSQIKVFDDNWITIGSLSKGGYGLNILPNGYSYFAPSLFVEYAWMNLTYATNQTSKCYIVDFEGEHTFYVIGDGHAVSKGEYLTSDSTLKKDIENLVNPLQTLLKLHGVSYRFKEKPKHADTIKYTDKNGNIHKYLPNQEERWDPTVVNPKLIDTLISEKKKKHFGVIAQEVEKVVPDMVRTMPDGTKTVEYNSIIGLMIEAIKEQQREINWLREQISNKKINSDDGENEILKSQINSDEIKIDSSILFQNVPNPFSQMTRIQFIIAKSSKHADLLLFNMQGVLLKSFSDLDKSTTELVVNGSEFNPGMYLYSLIVDGKEIGTKRMILTER